MQSAEEVIVGANGNFYTAPAVDDLTLPDDPVESLDARFAQHGFVTGEGVKFNDSKEIEDLDAWQSFYPIRKIVVSKASKISLELRQFNSKNCQLAFGGGSVDTSGGVTIYVPPMPGELDNRAAVVKWNDDDKHYALVMPRGIVTDDVETDLVRTNSVNLPIGFEATPEGNPVEGDETTFPFYIVTNDPDFADESSS